MSADNAVSLVEFLDSMSRSKPLKASEVAERCGVPEVDVLVTGLRLGVSFASAGRFWSDAELEFLHRFYRAQGSDVVGRVLGRSPNSVRLRARKEGLTKSYALREPVTSVGSNPYKVWSVADIEFLYSHMGKLKVADVARALGRSTSSVVSKCHELGLNTRFGSHAWDSAEDDVVRSLEDGVPVSEVVASLPSRSERLVRARARELGVVIPRASKPAESVQPAKTSAPNSPASVSVPVGADGLPVLKTPIPTAPGGYRYGASLVGKHRRSVRSLSF